MITTLTAAVAVIWTLASASETAPFTLKIVSPAPLYLVGPCKVEAAALEAGGVPYERIAYMTLSVNGRPAPADTAAPFSWDLDLGPDLKRHRLELEAVDREGRRARLVVVSATHPFVEAVGVELVLVPVTVREAGQGGGPGRLIQDLEEKDFTVLEDGVPQRLASFSKEPAPLSVVVAIDNSASMERSLWSAQKAVTEFVRAQPPYSAVSLLAFNDQVYLEHDFSHEKERLASAVMALRAEGTRTALYDALKIGSAYLGKRPGARVLVLFTDGQETVHEGEIGRLRTAIEAAQAADITVFAVAFGAANQEDLGQITTLTGGEVVPARAARELRPAFERIAESLSGRYVLGYEPPDPSRPGYRQLEVRVRRPGVAVMARKGYVSRAPARASQGPSR